MTVVSQFSCPLFQMQERLIMSIYEQYKQRNRAKRPKVPDAIPFDPFFKGRSFAFVNISTS